MTTVPRNAIHITKKHPITQTVVHESEKAPLK